MMWSFSLWALLPPIFFVGTAAGLWMVYFVAVYNKNIIPLSPEFRTRNASLYPPFISVAGNFPPASCIFSEVMNLAAFVGKALMIPGFVICVLRFLQLKNKIDKPWLNYVSAAAFSVGCFGMTLVGNFQLFELNLIHEVGSLMTFGLGTVYFWMQSYITLRVNLKNEGKIVAIARFLLSAAITLCIILKLFLAGISYIHAARCQWTVVMFFLIFISTFSIEFRHCHFEMSFRERVDDPIGEMETSDVFRQQLEPL